MLGYAIATCLKDNTIVGLNIVRFNTETMEAEKKTITLGQAKKLLDLDADALYNVRSITKTELGKLPVLNVDTKALSSDKYTILYEVDHLYMVSNAYGQVVTVGERDVQNLKITNMNRYKRQEDNSDDIYDKQLLLNCTNISINNGIMSLGEGEYPVLQIPSAVEGFTSNCFFNSIIGDLFLGTGITVLEPQMFTYLNAGTVIVSRSVAAIQSLAFAHAKIKKLIILGNVDISQGAFNLSDIKHIYALETMQNKCRKVLASGMKLHDLKDLR